MLDVSQVRPVAVPADVPPCRQATMTATPAPPSVGPTPLNNASAHEVPSGSAAVRTMRDRKLSRLAFRHGPGTPRHPGEPVSFLSDDLVREFHIPDEVPVSAHPYAPRILDLIQSHRDKLFLDVGAGLRHTYQANVVNLDIYANPSTDFVSVAEDMPFADGQFDFVLSFAVMEHVRRPWEVASEICRVVKPGGTVIIDYPFMSPMHGYPHHYFNATPEGNRSLFEPYCDIISVEPEAHHNPAVPLQWLLTTWRNGLGKDLADRFSSLTVQQLIDWDLIDLLGQPFATGLHPAFLSAIAGGTTLVGVKRPASPPVPKAAPIDAGPTLGDLLAERDRLGRLNRELGAAIGTIHASTSWRLTAPLRSVARLLGRR